MSHPTTQPSVSPDKVVERLCRDPVGAALWRACIAEELVEVYRERVEQLESQQAPRPAPS